MPNKNNKVTFVINSLEGGGAEKVLHKIISNLKQKTHYDLQLILLDELEEKHAIPDGIDKITLGVQGSMLKSIVGLYQCLKKERPQLIISFLARANCASVIACKLLSIPCVVSERIHTSGYYGNNLSGIIYKTIIKALYPKADRVIAVSGGVKLDLINNFSVAEERTEVIYNPYDFESINKLASQDIDRQLPKNYIVAMGRLEKVKNFDVLISAFSQLNTQMELVIMGQGSEKKALLEKAKLTGVAHRVHLLGYNSNPYPIIKNADLFVLSSAAEGFPNALVEAMILGRPVIASNCPSGPSEILAETESMDIEDMEKSKYGYLTPVGDDKALKEAIEELLIPNNYSHYQSMSHSRAKDYNIKTVFPVMPARSNSR